MQFISTRNAQDMIIGHFSVQPLDLAHGGLDVEALHVLPVLLQQRDEEVHGQVDVLNELLLTHLHVAHGDAEAENLLHLELDGGLEVQGLLLQIVIMGDEGRELASLRRNIDKSSNNTYIFLYSSPC